MKLNNTITDVQGIRVGHAHDEEALTGCTVVLCEAGAVGGIDQRGGAPGTRETDALHPMHMVEKVHAIVLAGGSAFGLDAATGAVRYLEERGVGYDTVVAKVPIVPAAIIYDLGIGRADIRPDAAMGYQACVNASSEPAKEGNVGAGMGATVGKILGMGRGMKGGTGTASVYLGRGLVVGAIVVVNALGDIIDPSTGQIIAGARSIPKEGSAVEDDVQFADTIKVMRFLAGGGVITFARVQNTAVGVVATNAKLNKEQVNKVAQMAQDGLARTIRPAHTMLDGDTIFALATGVRKADVNIIGAFAAEVMAAAVLRAVRTAEPIAGLPSTRSINPTSTS